MRLRAIRTAALLMMIGFVPACGKQSPSGSTGVPGPGRTAGPESEARRHSIPGGQVILPDDPAFKSAPGWEHLEFDAAGRPSRWSTGRESAVEWKGPEASGEYVIRAAFWRFLPFPAREVVIEFRLTGDPEWKSVAAGIGRTVIEGRVSTAAPGETLRMEFRIPTWVPKDSVPGEIDPRELGASLEAIEVIPAAQAVKASGE